jgi:hypothetical protein
MDHPSDKVPPYSVYLRKFHLRFDKCECSAAAKVAAVFICRPSKKISSFLIFFRKTLAQKNFYCTFAATFFGVVFQKRCRFVWPQAALVLTNQVFYERK